MKIGILAALAATLAAHNQFGLPAFGIYGREVQDLGDEKSLDAISQKLLGVTLNEVQTAFK